MTLTPLILSVLFIFSVAHAQSEFEAPVGAGDNIIYWGKPSFAPMYITSGEDRNLGFGDIIVRELEKLLPQYQHEETRANYIRLMSEINRGNNTCVILHKTPEREQFAYYSNVLLLSPSYQLYSSASAQNKFQHFSGWREGQVSFNDLLANSEQLRMAKTPGHSYGQARDEIIRRHQKNLKIIKGYAGQKSLIKMLLAERVDLILEFPWVVNHHLKKFKIKPSQLKKVTLTDVPAYEPAYIACPKTPWGKKLVTALNSIEPPIHIQLGAYIEDWLEPVEMEEFRRASREYFGED